MSEVDKTINNSFEQELIDNGYKIFKDNWKNSIRGFQKKFTDEKGIRYFINVYHYNYAKQIAGCNIEPVDTYSFDSQFRVDKNNKDACVDVTYSADMLPNKYRPVTTLQEVERFFDEFFVKFNVDYYETSE